MDVLLLLATFLLALLLAVPLCGAFVWFYNRTLCHLHESVLKKLAALTVLPLGCVGAVGLAVATLWGGWAVVPTAALAVLGAAITLRYLCVAQKRAELERTVRFRSLGPGGDRMVAWENLPRGAVPVLRMLRPFNVVTALRLRVHEIAVPNLDPAFDGYRVVHLADFHLHPTLRWRWYDHVVEQTMALRPDLVLFSGDFISRARHAARIPSVFRKLSAPDGVWYVRGNHDFWRGAARIRRLAARAGMQLLSNEATLIARGEARLALIGFETPYLALSPARASALAELPEDAPRIALVHTPDAYRDALFAGCFLALAGHTHGGQVRLPLFGTTVSGTEAGPLVASGAGLMGKMQTITSNGVGAFFPLRILCPPEIVLIVLRRSSHD